MLVNITSPNSNTPEERLARVFELAYECLRKKINSGRIRVENEASLQLQFAAILKVVGELFEVEKDEFFSIELEKTVTPVNGEKYGKSGSSKARIDIFFSYTNTSSKTMHSCAIEMKFFKKENAREPNNRYDVFADLHNLENYSHVANQCFMLVATDHNHYVSHPEYSETARMFDFRNDKEYIAGTTLIYLPYKNAKLYGNPITLSNSYNFKWDTVTGGLHFLRIKKKKKMKMSDKSYV